MRSSIDFIIDRQLGRWELERKIAGRARESEPGSGQQAIVTVSRQHGSTGATIATRVAERFGYTLLHRDVIDRMCESSGHTRRLLEALDEHSRSEITSWFESMLGGSYVNASDYVKALFNTVASIGRLGGVVVVGRGANFILGPERGFHVRVVAPRELRIEQLAARKDLTLKEATREVETRDRERENFVRQVFGRSVDDPLAYDLILNQAGLSEQTAVELIASAATSKLERMRGAGVLQRV